MFKSAKRDSSETKSVNAKTTLFQTNRRGKSKISLCVERSNIGEGIVQGIWQHQLTAKKGLATSRGEDLKVVYPGKPNSDKGPDFFNAIITLGKGGETNGDIEVHVKSSQWKAHGHHKNPGYNGVVLHVVVYRVTPYLFRGY